MENICKKRCKYLTCLIIINVLSASGLVRGQIFHYKQDGILMNYTDAVTYCKTRGAQWGLPDFQNFTSLLAEFTKEKNITSIWLGIHKVILPTWTWTTGSPFLSKNNLFWKIKITVLVKRVIKYPRIDQCNNFLSLKHLHIGKIQQVETVLLILLGTVE